MVLLVRYGELALKSRFVRRQLEDRLGSNVREMFAANGAECIVKVGRGRLFVHANEEAIALRLLRRVFGIVSISPATEGPSDLDTLTQHVVGSARLLLNAKGTFAIRPRRSGDHPYTSQDLARVLGRAVQDAVPGVAVDLDAPDVEIHVEVRGPRAYVFHEIVPGPGGLPLGSQGEVLAVVEDEAGMVATWLAMRRGCRARVTGAGPDVEALRAWDTRLVVLASRSPEDVLRLAAEKGDIPVVTAASPDPSPPSEDRPLILRPLLGLSGEEVRAIAERIRNA